MSEEKKGKFIIKSLMGEIYSYNQGCDDITLKGKRCKNAFKYRYKDEVKDCGSYCVSHCKTWMYKVLKAVIKKPIIANDKEREKFHTNISGQNIDIVVYYWGEMPHFVKYQIENKEENYILYNQNWEEKYIKERLNNFIKMVIPFLCKSEYVNISINLKYKKKIYDLEVGGIRGWTVNNKDNFHGKGASITIEKKYTLNI